MMKMRYHEYDQTIDSDRLDLKPSDPINVFINFESVLTYLSTVQDIDHKLEIYRDAGAILTSAAMNLIAHYRRFFREYDMDVKVFLFMTSLDVPEQEAITKDNVSVKINAVLYYKVFDASKAILAVENFRYAVSQLAQTTMRNAVGAVSLDELLGEREKISGEICKVIDEATDPWGIKVENVELKDISLPEEMKRVIAKAAEAEREKAAVITKAQGEVEASQNLAKAAEIMATTPGALHLRTLSTLNDISSDQSNTIVFAVPIEVLRAFENNDITKVIKK